MGELILCKRPIAAVPYYIEDVSLNVYSIEELCYYVANNAYLINTEFASVELCNWIGREVGKEEEKVLLTILEEEKPLHVFINTLLNLCDYLPGEEIRNVTEIISSFENKSPIECSKIRADRLLDKNKIVDAIYEYENILDKCEQDKKDISKEFMGDIWHNLAVCYSRLFFFKEASVCFEYAYQLNRATGIAQIEAIVELAGYFSGVILIITTLFLLYFLNYQRYISDAKQRIAYILMTVATISAYTFIGDVILTIIMDAFL